MIQQVTQQSHSQNKTINNEKKKYHDPLNKGVFVVLSNSNEIGTAISDIAPKLGAALWAPTFMYLGADIYDKYKNDYIPPLFWHSFHWSCCILLPYLVISQLMHYALGTVMPSFLVALAANTLVHMFIDHQKANCKSINLVQDQLLHILQMLLTHVCFIDILAV